MEAADNALVLAKALAGQGGISDQDFLERMARSDELADHDGTTCGHCHYMILGAEVAREMIEAGEYQDVVQVGGGTQAALGEEQVLQAVGEGEEGRS
jgi:hypothetical protein